MANQLRDLLAETPIGKTLTKEQYGVKKQDNQVTITKNFKTHERESYTEQQNILYNRALFGLSVYTEEELKKMPRSKRNRILAVHKKAQVSINALKQEIVIGLSDRLFNTIFPGSYLTKQLLEHPECRSTEETYICKMSFKKLRITKSILIHRLVRQGILPRDFYQLTNKL